MSYEGDAVSNDGHFNKGNRNTFFMAIISSDAILAPNLDQKQNWNDYSRQFISSLLFTNN